MGRRNRDIKIVIANAKSIQDLYEELNKKDVNDIIRLLFKDTIDELENYQNYSSTHAIRKRIDFIVDFAHYDKNVDIEDVKDRLQDLYCRIDDKASRKKEGHHKRKNKQKDRKTNRELRKLAHDVFELRDIIDAFGDKNDKQNEFLKSIIFEHKNLYFLKNTLNYFPEAINTTDLENRTIIYNVIFKYLQELEKNPTSDDTFFYQDVMEIILNNEHFNFNSDDKKDCLGEVLNQLIKLDVNDEQYTEKKRELIDLKDTLGGTQRQKADIVDIQRKYNIQVGFDEHILSLMKARFVDCQSPKAVLNDYIISIDGEGSIELDDAFSARVLPNGNYLLGVHIASVTSFFDYDSEIVQQAIARSETIYNGRSINPIFPLEYSANYGSLIEGAPKYAESHYFEITPDGEIVNESLLKTVIVNRKRTTYNKVDEVIRNGSQDLLFNCTVKTLVKITNALSKRYGITPYEEGDKERSFSNEIVFMCNLLNNETIANFFAENKFPIIYRVQEQKTDVDRDLEKRLTELAKLCDKSKPLNITSKILQYDQNATYALSGRHEGLGLEHYTHCSSPLRRGADIVVQRGLDLFYHNLGTVQDQYRFEDSLPAVIHTINKQNEKIKRYLYECNTRL